MWWGLAGALAAAVAYGLASILQASAADSSRDASAEAVVFKPRFVLGMGLDAVGFGVQVAALQVLPLFVVQSALAASLAVTAVAARVLGVRLGRREWLAVGGVCVGLGLLGVSAGSEGNPAVGHGFRWALGAAVAVLVLARLSIQLVPRRLHGPLLGLIAGLGFGVVAISARIIPSLAPAHLITEPAAYTAVAGGALAMLCYAAALQRGGVTTATAMLVVGETVFPALVGLLLLDDRARHGYAAVAACGFVVAVAAALVLARFGEPGQAVSAPAGSPPSRESST
ncbi:drug/metabolite transporter (DMT)-like permease [Kribbella aluminosa]|uniref:Drug/metabolite transporter (DMT)-like permease n=1 Tax=Kribbella aluminosa TaxID=416017 RepID=A0ABS4V056_9ACTN|nr:hypothetical protein [Kribbella aluminosa]MBP2357159.1 drug/metabolite transporter (DMT)-like permease [Kribbella aluminosa]